MLSDPRRYAASPFPTVSTVDFAQHTDAQLKSVLRRLAAGAQDDEIAQVLAAAPCAVTYRRVWRALCDAVEHPLDDDPVRRQVIAIPWIIVCAGTSEATIDCALRDVDSLARVLQQNGFGRRENLALADVLCSIEALESLRPSEVLNGWDQRRIRELEPSPIRVRGGVEEVHARFLLGAMLATRSPPDVLELGSGVGAWGAPALRAMAAQLAVPNVQILPMPRPPAGIYTAAYAGRSAAVEAAFNLFTSNAVRRFRLAVGDPSVALSSHVCGELRVTLWTAFDEGMVEGFRWPLHPADALNEIEHIIRSLIGACRLPDPSVYPEVLPDRTSTGAVLFPCGNGSRS